MIRTLWGGAMTELGKILILIGAVLVLTGLIMNFAGKIPGVGRLPGDILIRRENFSFYFPITTSILISLVLTLVFSFLNKK